MTGADVSDARGASAVLGEVLVRYGSVRVVIADGVYDRAGLLAWWLGQWEVGLECVGRFGGSGFVVLLRRWLVERSFAWWLLGYGMPYPYLFVSVLGCVVCGGGGLDMVGRGMASDAVYCKGWFLNSL